MTVVVSIILFLEFDGSMVLSKSVLGFNEDIPYSISINHSNKSKVRFMENEWIEN